MLNKKLLMAAGAATLSASFFSGTLMAVNLATGNASANVVQPIAIVPGASGIELDFGNIVPDTVATADVILTPAGIIASASPAVVTGSTTGGDFDVTGSNDVSFTITVPTNGTVTLTDTGGNGGTAMAVKDFTTDQPGDVGTLSGAGAQTIAIGATLTVGINQAESTYSGTYDITVNYQ